MSDSQALGAMWEHGHLRPLGWSEYLRWIEEPLPLGWKIICAPEPGAGDRAAARLPRVLGGPKVRPSIAKLARLLGRKHWLHAGDRHLLIAEWRGTLYVLDEQDASSTARESTDLSHEEIDSVADEESGLWEEAPIEGFDESRNALEDCLRTAIEHTARAMESADAEESYEWVRRVNEELEEALRITSTGRSSSDP